MKSTCHCPSRTKKNPEQTKKPRIMEGGINLVKAFIRVSLEGKLLNRSPDSQAQQPPKQMVIRVWFYSKQMPDKKSSYQVLLLLHSYLSLAYFCDHFGAELALWRDGRSC